MSRYLFVVPPMAGHVNPTLAVGRELAARGHAVAWTGPDDVVGPLLPGDATFLPTPLAPACARRSRRGPTTCGASPR